MNKFSVHVRKRLGYYVYIYVDPRTDEIFYIGKGADNRAFFHLDRVDESAIAQRIAEIRKDNKEPKVEILVHGLEDPEVALRVEAAAIDLLGREQLVNAVAGWRSREYGRYSTEEIEALYSEAPIVIDAEDKVVLIQISQFFFPGMKPEELYEATRGVWVLNPHNRQPQFAFAVFEGIVREIYEIASWFPAKTTVYFTREIGDDIQGRWEFVGRIASEEIRHRYLLKSVRQYFPSGAQNPIRYVNCEIK